MNRDAIKYIAVFGMLLNHISLAFLQKGTVVGEVFLDLGYITAPVMCYFLVEGYYYTRSRRRYGMRLLGFALLSQLPFHMALTPEKSLPGRLNMLFTLFVCFLILEVKTRVRQENLRLLSYCLLILANSFCDWPTMASIYTLLFAYAYGTRWKLERAFGIAALFFGLTMYTSNRSLFPAEQALLLTGGAMMGFLAAAWMLLYLYNGQQAKRGRSISKWFFYLFYPAHLAVIAGIRMYLGV